MADTPMHFATEGATYITSAGGTTVFTVPAGSTYIAGRWTILNVTDNIVTITVIHVPSGGSVSGFNNYLVRNRQVPVQGGILGGTVIIDELVGEIFEEGDALVLLAGTASTLKYHGNVVEEIPE